MTAAVYNSDLADIMGHMTWLWMKAKKDMQGQNA